ADGAPRTRHVAAAPDDPPADARPARGLDSRPARSTDARRDALQRESRRSHGVERGGTAWFPHGPPPSSVDRRGRPCAPARARSGLRARIAPFQERRSTDCPPRAGGRAFGIPATLAPPPAKTR